MENKSNPMIFSEIIGQPTGRVARALDSGFHVLIHGQPGIGKTMTLDAAVRWFGGAKFHALKYRRETEMMESVEPASRAKGNDIIGVDEVEHLTSKGQSALRNILDSAASTFILTTNHPNEVMDAIKSRCVDVEYTPLSEEHLGEIGERELGITVDPNDYSVGGDARKFLQEAKINV